MQIGIFLFFTIDVNSWWQLVENCSLSTVDAVDAVNVQNCCTFQHAPKKLSQKQSFFELFQKSYSTWNFTIKMIKKSGFFSQKLNFG